MGSNVTHVQGNGNHVNVESKVGVNVYEQIRERHGEFVVGALKDVTHLIDRAGDAAAAEDLRRMTEAIACRDIPRQEVRTYWERITSAIPSLLNSPAAGALVAGLMR